MRKGIKVISAVVAAVAVLGLFFYILNFFGQPSSILRYLPEPPDLRQYALIETRENNFPLKASALLTNGPFALLHKGTSRNALLLLAQTAREASVLLINDGLGSAEVYAAYRLPVHMSSKLGKGEAPNEWLKLMPSARVEKGSEKDSWEIWSPAIDEPIFYYTDKENIILAADEATFGELIKRRSEKSKKKHVWEQEKSWPGHAELGDGTMLSGRETPLKIQFAWRSLKPKSDNDPAGEAKWIISGLKTGVKAAMLLMVKPVEWDTAKLVTPTPTVLAAALNIPKLKGSPRDWPFPLSTAAKLAEMLNLSESSVKEVASGKTVFSLGGRNKLLWLTLPGLLVEFSGKEATMRELVESFWNNFFLETEPKKLEGWDFGGTATSPFSVVGAGRGNTALIGLISHESLHNGEWLSQYIGEKEKAIGWLFADLSGLGGSLSDMTKIMSLLTFEDGGDYDEDSEEAPYRPGELDYGVTESFRRVLKDLGRVFIVWERPKSGRLNWYK